jgi:hypothetical protein
MVIGSGGCLFCSLTTFIGNNEGQHSALSGNICVREQYWDWYCEYVGLPQSERNKWDAAFGNHVETVQFYDTHGL